MWNPLQFCTTFLNKIGASGDAVQCRDSKKYVDLSQYDTYIPEEMFDFIKVLQQAKDSGKYDDRNWLKPDGKTMSRRDNFASCNRHLAANYMGERIDPDSKLEHLLHLGCRAMMEYTRRKRGIIHPDDPEATLTPARSLVDFISSMNRTSEQYKAYVAWCRRNVKK